MTFLVGALAILGLFATRPIPEYCPQFILSVDVVDTTCGGMGCGGCTIYYPNPNSPLPKPTQICGGLLTIPEAPRWENTARNLKVESPDFREAPDPSEYE